MKQILYVAFALFFSVIIFSCGGGKNYEIKGMIANPSLDGEYVYLQKIENDALQTVDSALVKDQRFKFTGIADSAVIREISFGNKGTGLAPVVFVLQQGHMEAYVDTFSTMTGTVDNDKLTEFHEDQAVAADAESLPIRKLQLEVCLTYIQRQTKQCVSDTASC